jgi:hypothetical protein
MTYDAFISHASEDKPGVARPLASQLGEAGLRIWLDECELTVGDSLRREIDKGLSKSRFGIVILSPAFFAKEWPQKELDALVAREDGKEKVILPVWHGVSKSDVSIHASLLADKLAVSTSNGLAHVTQQLITAIRKSGHEATTTDLESEFPASDMQMLEELYVCFDRPAFRVTFEHEANLEHLMHALEDTIASLNTGIKRRRDGIVFGEPIKGKSYFKSDSLRESFDRIVDLLSQALSTYTKAKMSGYFFDLGGGRLAFHSSHPDEAMEVAVTIDDLRNEALILANVVYARIGKKPFSLIKTPEWYRNRLSDQKR